MSKRLTKDDLPTSLGAFKPVDHIMVALPDDVARNAFTDDLLVHGFTADDVLHFSAAEGASEMTELIEDASDFAGFGYEITLMRRYVDLSRKGHRWVVVYAPEDEQAEQVKEAALRHGAPMAVKYHLLAVEDLI